MGFWILIWCAAQRSPFQNNSHRYLNNRSRKQSSPSLYTCYIPVEPILLYFRIVTTISMVLFRLDTANPVCREAIIQYFCTQEPSLGLRCQRNLKSNQFVRNTSTQTMEQKRRGKTIDMTTNKIFCVVSKRRIFFAFSKVAHSHSRSRSRALTLSVSMSSSVIVVFMGFAFMGYQGDTFEFALNLTSGQFCKDLRRWQAIDYDREIGRKISTGRIFNSGENFGGCGRKYEIPVVGRASCSMMCSLRTYF